MKTEGLVLHSSGLLSKWGFNDGDVTDETYDLYEENDIQSTKAWHAILEELVKEFLVPVLKQKVEVYFINTNHNPVRASSIDGREVVIDGWSQPSDLPKLEPEFVIVPWNAVLERLVK